MTTTPAPHEGHISPRTTLKRHKERAVPQREAVDAILDEGMICHLACAEGGQPWMLPTAYGRDGDHLYVHGAAANHLLRTAAGAEVVVAVTLLDGMVLARSTFHHSLNYRSVIVFGRAAEVTDPAEKAHAMEVIVDGLLPGRSEEARPPTEAELRQTRVLRIPLTEVSAKARTGGPIDDPDDLALPVWAGVLPLHTTAAAAEPEPDNGAGLPLPRGVDQPARWNK